MSSARMNHFNKIKDYYANAHKEMCVAVQTETIEAIENIPAIAKVSGVDGIFIGPSDLAASMGHIGNPTHKEVHAAIRRGMESAHEGGKPAGILPASEPAVPRNLEWGLERPEWRRAGKGGGKTGKA